MSEEQIPRCGDSVRHKPSGETWVVAWAEDGRLSACGWPASVVPLADCELVERASEAEHLAMVEAVQRGLAGDMRAHKVRRLYGPPPANKPPIEEQPDPETAGGGDDV